jgi:hypothetical protein
MMSKITWRMAPRNLSCFFLSKHNSIITGFITLSSSQSERLSSLFMPWMKKRHFNGVSYSGMFFQDSLHALGMHHERVIINWKQQHLILVFAWHVIKVVSLAPGKTQTHRWTEETRGKSFFHDQMLIKRREKHSWGKAFRLSRSKVDCYWCSCSKCLSRKW